MDTFRYIITKTFLQLNIRNLRDDQTNDRRFRDDPGPVGPSPTSPELPASDIAPAALSSLSLDAPAHVDSRSPEERAGQEARAERALAVRAELEPTFSPVTRACIASGADSASTILGLSLGFVEANPLLPSSIPFMVALGAARCGVSHYYDKADFTEFEKVEALHIFDAAWSAAAVNNFLVIAGYSTPVGLAAFAGVIYYKWTQGAGERAYAAECGRWKAENPQLTCSPYVDPAKIERRLAAIELERSSAALAVSRDQRGL